jgi:hypothetical protein
MLSFPGWGDFLLTLPPDMPGVLLLVFLSGLFGDPVPADAFLGPDDPGQGAAAKSRVDLVPQFIKDLIGITPQKFFLRMDPYLAEFCGRGRADIGKRSQRVSGLWGTFFLWF